MKSANIRRRVLSKAFLIHFYYYTPELTFQPIRHKQRTFLIHFTETSAIRKKLRLLRFCLGIQHLEDEGSFTHILSSLIVLVSIIRLYIHIPKWCKLDKIRICHSWGKDSRKLKELHKMEISFDIKEKKNNGMKYLKRRFSTYPTFAYFMIISYEAKEMKLNITRLELINTHQCRCWCAIFHFLLRQVKSLQNPFLFKSRHILFIYFKLSSLNKIFIARLVSSAW